MDAVLRQSRAVCPFLKSASPATLRALSTSARPKASPGGGAMSKLQVLAHRCPVMGKAMAVQSSPSRHGAAASIRAMSSAPPKTAKARIHTSRNQEARAVDSPLFDGRDKGKPHSL